MSRHLTDEEILDLCAPGAAPDEEIREHLAACGSCRARIEGERPLSERLTGLAGASDPPRDLWPALRARLASEPQIGDRPRRHRAALQAAAAIAIFSLGAAAGRSLPQDPAGPDRYAPGDPLSAAAEVQRTGTAYVEAVARFRSVATSSESGAAGQAREVALAAVHGAAFELARLNPEDGTAREILALARDRRPRGEAP
jgi:hypothetical protein